MTRESTGSHIRLADEEICTAAPHLDDTGGSPHAEEVLPLQDGPEAALQRHYPPQHLLVEEGLETVALRLPQKHLRDKQNTALSLDIRQPSGQSQEP